MSILEDILVMNDWLLLYIVLLNNLRVVLLYLLVLIQSLPSLEGFMMFNMLLEVGIKSLLFLWYYLLRLVLLESTNIRLFREKKKGWPWLVLLWRVEYRLAKVLVSCYHWNSSMCSVSKFARFSMLCNKSSLVLYTT